MSRQTLTATLPHADCTSRRALAVAGCTISFALHFAVAAALVAVGPRSTPKRRATVLRMAIQQKRSQKPVVPPKPAVRPAEPKPARPATRSAQRMRKRRKGPRTTPPTNNAQRPRDTAPPVTPVFGVSMNSVVTSGGTAGFAVPVGNTLATDPSKRKPGISTPYSAPSTMPRQRAASPTPARKLTEMPRPIRLVKARYPEQARLAGIHGEIVMRLTIGIDGRVRAVRIVKGLGHGLDQLARQAAKKFRFTPAKVAGRPVATVISFSYRWEISD